MPPTQLSFATLLSLLLTALSTAAQETPSAEPEPAATEDVFFDRIAVDIVNVEVYVTDKDGEPVTHLGRDDFIVTEDRRPVEVVNFHHVSGGRVATETQSPETSAPEAERDLLDISRMDEPEVPESQRLHLVVYVDNYHIHPLNRNRVFGRLRAFLQKVVRPGDEVMIASYDRSLHIRHPFTGDPDLVANVLYDLERFSGAAVERESERADAVKAIYESRSLREAEARARQFSEAGYHELGLSLQALEEMIDSLAGLPGRKMLLHVSDGLPMVPGQDLYQAIQQRYADLSALGQAITWDKSRQYNRLISLANSNRTSFYTIDAGGLRVQSGMGAENPSVNSPHVVSGTLDGVRRRNLQAPLVLMAKQTGGQTIMNTNNVTAGLDRFASDFGNYYSLGYRAPNADRGRYHKIEVRLKDKVKGWRIRHRDGYRAKPIEKRISDSVTSYLVHGYQTNPLGVSIELGPQSPGDDDYFNVPIRIRVPMSDLALLPQGDFHVGRLRFYFGAIDEKGRDADLQELPYELRIPSSSLAVARQDEVVRVITATMRKGNQKLVVGVRDEISEEKSIVGRSVRVGTAAKPNAPKPKSTT